MHRRAQRWFFAVAGAVAAALALGGCGLASHSENAPVTVIVTRDFGASRVAAVNVPRSQSTETMEQLLERSLHARLAPAGSVHSIEGLSSGGGRGGWFSFINGIGSSISPNSLKLTKVHPGDRVWWDLHDLSATATVRAVVGAYPEPFKHGSAGRKLPTTLECGPNVSAACKRVTAALSADGVPIATQLLGTGSGQDSIGVVVGTWSELTPQLVARLVEHGPAASGIYARFMDGGASLQLLDASGNVARTLGAGAGLVAATSDSQSKPTWLITGTDPAGVSAAARALTASMLQCRFAVAVDGGAEVALPVRPAG
jgi:hypothetical protein